MHSETPLFLAAPDHGLSVIFHCRYCRDFTSRATLGVDSSLYGPSAHFLVDIVKLEVGITNEREHSFGHGEHTRT